MRFVLALFLFAAPAFAELVIPPKAGPVVDAGEMLSHEAAGQLESFLYRLKDAGTEIQVITLPDLGGASIEEAGLKIAEAYGIGRAATDKGVVFVMSKAERKVRLEVGYGLEGELPDLTASRIIREVVIPRFKNGDVDRGVINGVLAITHYTNPNFLEGQNAAPAPAGVRKHGKRFDWIWFLLFFVFFVLPFFTGGGRRRSGLGGFLLGYGMGGGFGGRGGGGFGSGSSWGGGGGGFGGGGASGSW